MPKQQTHVRAAVLAALKRPQTVAGAALFAIGASIFANALLLQPGPHPAPFFTTHARPPVQAGQPDELVRAVQDALKQVGYYSGPLDGISGSQTHSAIETFEAQSGRERTGEATLELLGVIQATSRPDLPPVATEMASTEQAPDVTQPVAAPQAVQPDPLVAAVQDALARSAYGSLVADGVVGPDTQQAIKRFQRDHDLPVTGEVSDALVVELRAAGALGGE
jgi:peptidoglycan hydrolase-like protein with peptidoglycan-binding domain